MTHQQFGQYPNPTASELNKEPLPPGWEMMIDRATGWPFFVDHHNQRTSWQDPRMPQMNMPQAYGNKPQQPQQPRVREIPIVHETTGRQTPPRSASPRVQTPPFPTQGNPGSPAPSASREIPIRQIPIQHEGSPQRGSPARDTGRSQYGGAIPGHIRSEAYSHQRASSPTSQRFVNVPIHHQQDTPTSRPSPTPQYMGRDTPPLRSSPMPQYMGSREASPYRTQIQREASPYRPAPTPAPPTQPAPQMAPPSPNNQGAPQMQPSQPQMQPPSPQATFSAPPQLNIPPPTPPPAQPPQEGSPQQTPPPQAAPANNGAGLKPDPAPPKARSVSPAPQNLTPLEQIEVINEELQKHQLAVNTFSSTTKDKNYLYIEEMLTRLLMKLDGIESEGKDEIRMARKGAVKSVQACLDQLELKLFANETNIPADNNDSAMADRSESSQSQGSGGGAMSNGQSNNGGGKDPSRVNEMVMDSEVKC